MDLIDEEKVRYNKFPFPTKTLKIPNLSYGHLEEVAQIYVFNPWMQSSYLEWLLIDALLHNETARFAVTYSDIPAQKFFQKIKQLLLRNIKRLLSEGFALALTAFVSNLIDETQGIAFWVILATVTLGRWLNPIKVQQAIQRQEIKVLVADMIGASEKTRKFDYNARQLRELLYDLEKRGAVYSSSIFNVLDKRIARMR